MAENQCRYCGNGGCKRKVVAFLITTQSERGTTTKSETPICGVAAVTLQRSFKAYGNVNKAGQMLSMRYI